MRYQASKDRLQQSKTLHRPLGHVIEALQDSQAIIIQTSKVKTSNNFVSSVLACHGIRKVRRENLERR